MTKTSESKKDERLDVRVLDREHFVGRPVPPPRQGFGITFNKAVAS
jgi:hypothetical protein